MQSAKSSKIGVESSTSWIVQLGLRSSGATLVVFLVLPQHWQDTLADGMVTTVMALKTVRILDHVWHKGLGKNAFQRYNGICTLLFHEPIHGSLSSQ